jgi:putative addiction module antidote
MHTLKLTQIGNAIGVILPNDVLSRLRLERGLTLFLAEPPEGLVITPFRPKQEEQVQAGRAFMKEFRDTFHQLAK